MKKHAVMLYIIKDNKILFLVRNKQNDTVHQQGKLLSIGGKVEEGESIENAVYREAKEEANIEVKDINLKAIIYFREFGTRESGVHDWIDYVYITSQYSGTPTPSNEGSFVWKDIKDINQLNIYSQDKVFLPLLLKYDFFAADFLLKDYDMVDYKILKAV